MADHKIRLREKIRRALGVVSGADFADESKRLLGAIGYKSERTLADQSGDPREFCEVFPTKNLKTATEQEFLKESTHARVVFQYTDEEISNAGSQRRLFEDTEFYSGNARSFLFIAVELLRDEYPRGMYAQLTREVNKRFPNIPAVVLFRTANGLLTLAFVHRRQNKVDPERDVLGRVSLIREIKPDNPHRAHLDILAELSLEDRLRWVDGHGKQRNFDGLLEAWLEALDTEELNRRFYRDLFGWFERAVSEAEFPSRGAKTLPAEEHVIRLITRLLFIWFIKEKGLVAEDLFIEEQVRPLLKVYDRAAGDSYYRAILQNLFFATLNTEIPQRGFSSRANATHRNFSLYRYRSEMTDPDGLVALFAKTPFINGGLFDCLDSEEATGSGGYRIDYFSDNVVRKGTEEYQKLSIPDRLFFDDTGLITLFNHYKFTVEENTPAETEVALDPELLGKVFENLLAAYNPETKETARKQTGSYYTPRAVVDFMVDEVLVAVLGGKVKPSTGDDGWWQERLGFLLDYDDAEDAGEFFDENETGGLVRAIAGLRVLDPAAGSGAFPMGVLHKLTLALRRLDPENRLWEELQKEIAGSRAATAFETQDRRERDEELREISATFERYRDSDYGRKLYLIQNSIYGVDIQPVACQIAKLRFFISLAIEQQPTGDPNANYGIQPLPNLETRFVAANTLLGLDEKALQIPLGGQNRVTELNGQLRENREHHFHAGVRQEKLRLRRQDARLRKALAVELERAGMSKSDAGKIASWDPYDQNARAKWFDAGYMFDVRNGFDVVIGNPPYVESRNSLFSAAAKDAYIRQVYADWSADIPRGSDLLIYFLARSARALRDEGVACLITQNAWLSTDYGKAFQDFTQGRFYFHRIVDTSAKFFSDIRGPNINAIIALFSLQDTRSIEYAIADVEMSVTPTRTIRARQEMKWGHVFAMPEFLEEILDLLRNGENRALRNNIKFGQGINVRKATINARGADVPTLLNSAHFVARVADSAVLKSAIGKRANKVPALIMPRGIGRYYCAFNSCKAHSFSDVDLYMQQGLWYSSMHYCLWAYMNSSLVWLFREVTGRRNLGGGMLKAEATDMRMLPIGFNFDFADAAKDLCNTLQNRDPATIQEEISTDEHLRIDNLVEEYFGITQHSDAIKEALLERVNLRESRARHRS